VEEVAAIGMSLIENKSPTELVLRDCHISGQGAGELAAALSNNTTLRNLDLRGNPIGDHVEGVAAIGMSLHNREQITDRVGVIYETATSVDKVLANWRLHSTRTQLWKFWTQTVTPLVWREPPPCRTCYTTTHH